MPSIARHLFVGAGSSRPGRPAEAGRGEDSSRSALLAAILLVVGRSLVFAWWDQPAFNSDHAIVGLMAKHLAEGRAFPLFFYGQSYMLGVEAWLAAPIFLVAGPSVLGLHLPLVALNALVACLLIVLLRRDLGLGQWEALAASSVFVLAPPATALALVEANGGSVEPLLYVLLLWAFRSRPALFGATLGFGFLHREITLYGLLALAVVRLASRRKMEKNDCCDVHDCGYQYCWQHEVFCASDLGLKVRRTERV